MAVRREYIADLYRNILGREGSEGEIEGHVDNPGGEQGLLDLFNSVAGNHSDGQVNEATVGSAPQIEYQQQYQTQNEAPPVIPDTPPGVSGGYEAAQADNSAARTSDQWSGNDTVMPTTNFGRMTGYDLSNFNNTDMQTLKYQAGRIASRYDPANPNALNQLMSDPEFQRLFPTARVVDARSGTVNFGSAGDIDVIKDFGAPNAQWAWQPTNGAPGSTPSASQIPSGVSSSGGASPGSARSTGSTLGDLKEVYRAVGQQYAGPGDAGITNGPLQQVGQDPLSQLISGALAQFIGNEGTTRLGGDVEAALASLIAGGGDTGSGAIVDPGDIEGDLILPPSVESVGLNDGQIARRYESARELLDKGRRTLLNDMRGDLANRNLLSEPGIPQGAEIGGIQRVTESLAPEFSRMLRDIYTDEVGRQIAIDEAERDRVLTRNESAQSRRLTRGESALDRNLTREQNDLARRDAKQLTALQLATGMASDQARNLLASIGEGTARQTALANIALQSLQTNMAWSQFLAEFGLKRDQVMYDIQNGQIEDILPILQAFIQLGGMANQGYV